MVNQYAEGGGIHNGTWYVYIPMSKEQFMSLDNGGSVYRLPSKSFEANEEHGLGNLEWVSREEIEPEDKVDYPSILDALLGNSINVYFVTQETADEIERLKSKNDWAGVDKMIKNLSPEKRPNQTE